MSQLRRSFLSLLLLLVSIGVPVFCSNWVSISTGYERCGWPVFAVLELHPEVVGDRLLRVYRSLSITPIFFLYLLFPLVGGFIAGRVWPRRSPKA